MNIIKSGIIGLGISVVLGSGAAFAAGDMPEHYSRLQENIHQQGQAAMQAELKQAGRQVLAEARQAGELGNALAMHEHKQTQVATRDGGTVRATGSGGMRIRIELPNISLPRLSY